MKLKLLIILLFISLITYGQSANRQYIGLSIGPSFPTSDYVKTDLNDSTSGWAKTGVAINVNYAYRLTHNFGLYAQGTFSSNKFNNIAYKDALDATHPDTTFSVESTRNWSGGGLLIGPYIRLPLSDNFSWDIRGSFGFYNSYSPKIIIRASTGDIVSRESASAFSYAYSFGSGFKFRMAKYYILLFADYINSPLQFNNAAGWDINDEYYTTQFNQRVSYVYVTIGIGYYF